MKKEEIKVDLGFNEDGSITLDRNLDENIYSKKEMKKTKEEPKDKDKK